jgi:hypothetical protein
VKSRIFKMLSIAVVLASIAITLSSTPVIGASETNDKFFPITWGFVPVPAPGSVTVVAKWMGPPTALSDGTTSITEPGLVRVADVAARYNNASGNFGPLGSLSGTNTIDVRQVTNYKIKTLEYFGTFMLDFDSHGTLTILVHNQRQFLYFYPAGSITEIWDADATYRSLEGTGDFENFHCVGRYWYDYSSNPAGVLLNEGTGWFAPTE